MSEDAMAGHIPPDLPAYVHIKRVLKNQIEDGELPEGARVPSEMELAREYNVSRNPTRQALRDLELEGYIVRAPGRGSFVAPMSKREKPLHIAEGRTLAVACPVLECHYTRQVIQGFTRYAAAKNFHTMVYFQIFSNESEFDFLADIRNSGIDGIAFWLQHPGVLTLELLEKFRRSSFPFVLIDRYTRSVEADFVVTDNEDVGYRLTKALTNRGHRTIGFITTPLDNTTAEDRLKGHKRALEEEGLPYLPGLTGITSDEDQSLSMVVYRIMAQQQRPTAFVCINDGVAAKLLDELEVLGHNVPEDIEVATVDDNELVQALDMPIIAASQVGYEMGRQSAEILIAHVEDPGRPMEKRFLKAELHIPQKLPTRAN
jgi:GntR family transcriptional regulator of arabinose operon